MGETGERSERFHNEKETTIVGGCFGKEKSFSWLQNQGEVIKSAKKE